MSISLSVEVADQLWPRFVYVPHNASVYINCTTDSNNPFWSINPAEDELDTPLQFATRGEDLNNEGLYDIKVSGGTVPPTLRLLINDTEVNNQTVIECVGRTVTNRTVIFLYGKYTISPYTLSILRCNSTDQLVPRKLRLSVTPIDLPSAINSTPNFFACLL